LTVPATTRPSGVSTPAKSLLPSGAYATMNSRFFLKAAGAACSWSKKAGER